MRCEKTALQKTRLLAALPPCRLALACAVHIVQLASLAALPPCFMLHASCFMLRRKGRRRVIVTIIIQGLLLYSAYHIFSRYTLIQ